VSLICCFHVEREKGPPTLLPMFCDRGMLVARGRFPSGLKPQGIEYRCVGHLADLLVVAVKLLLGTVGVEPRGKVIRGWCMWSTGTAVSGGIGWVS
jgi:hypothetical protein